MYTLLLRYTAIIVLSPRTDVSPNPAQKSDAARRIVLHNYPTAMSENPVEIFNIIFTRCYITSALFFRRIVPRAAAST